MYKDINENKRVLELSVIIVTYNNVETIDECLESIKKYNDLGESLEVIVVDNSLNNDTYDLIRNNYPWVKLFKSDKNGGFGYGNNYGVNKSSGRNLLFLNPDTILVEPVFNCVLCSLNKNIKIGAVGCHLITRDGKDMPSFNPLPDYFSFFTLGRLYYKILKFTPIYLRNYYPWGAFMGVRYEDFNSSGQFDEKIFLNFEEAVFIKRSKLNRIKILKEKVVHLESISKKSVNAEKCYFDTEDYYFSNYSKISYSEYKSKTTKKLKLKQSIFKIIGRDISPWEKQMMSKYLNG